MGDPKESLADILGRQEPLHPDLDTHLYIGGPLGHVLKHPLVFGVPYHPGMNAFYNRQYGAKKKALDDAIVKKHWSQAIFLHERPFRFQVLMVVNQLHRGENMTAEEWWQLVRGVWEDTENYWQFKAQWKSIWNPPERKLRDERYLAMEADERETLAGLPDLVTVYRGTHRREGARGLSWTVDYDKARWFAGRQRRTGHSAYVYQAVLPKDQIWVYLDGRSEREVVCLPRGKDMKLKEAV